MCGLFQLSPKQTMSSFDGVFSCCVLLCDALGRVSIYATKRWSKASQTTCGLNDWTSALLDGCLLSSTLSACDPIAQDAGQRVNKVIA